MTNKDETRQAILAAADSLFNRYGPVKTSVADIARHLGMSAANIYNFYPSRDAILEAAGTQHLGLLQRQITEEIARTSGDWARIVVLFMSTARHMREKLENEKDILQLQALATKNRWKFVEEFYEFLHKTAQIILSEAIDAGRLNHAHPDGVVEALFDCMMSALDPILILKFTRDDHFRRITAQLDLLERAFR
jgi:AcrR family transcriptional regulator